MNHENDVVALLVAMYRSPNTVGFADADGACMAAVATSTAIARRSDRCLFMVPHFHQRKVPPLGAHWVSAEGSLNPMRPERRDRIDAVAGEESSITASFRMQWFER